MTPRELTALSECSEFGLALRARPPRVVHGTALLLAVLLGAALLWAGLTEADLVVRAAGRVRPVTAPTKVVSGGRGESLSASLGCRVVEVNFHAGAVVREGDVLLRLDAGRLDNEIVRRRRALEAVEEELAQLARLGELAARQAEAARAKAEAELAQAEEEVRRARERQAADVRLAAAELSVARDEEERLRRVGRQAVAEADLVKAVALRAQAEEKLARARLPIEEGRVAVLRQALTLAEQDDAVRRQDLSLKVSARRAEAETARLELAGLELERQQAVVRAPRDGVVTAGDVKVGDLLEPGRTIAEIAGQEGFLFEAAVPSEEVGRLRVGMTARVKLDAFDWQKYGPLTGTVCFISPDSATPEGKGPATYVVRIALAGDEVGRGELRERVKLGMDGQAEIVTARESLLTLLLKKVRQSISLG
jgi:multidrug resistance efflux pump